MRLRLVVSLGVLIALFAVAAPARAVPVAPTRVDYSTWQVVTATKWLDSPGTLNGTSGPDVLIGSYGSDTIRGLSGDDIICSAPNQIIGGLGAPDNIDGGAGNDHIFGVGLIRGGSGDVLEANGPGSKAEGGGGNDTVEADNGASADGGSGNDDVYGSDAVELLGGSNSDIGENEYGNPAIDCGSGVDTACPNDATNLRRCETVSNPI